MFNLLVLLVCSVSLIALSGCKKKCAPSCKHETTHVVERSSGVLSDETIVWEESDLK